MLRRCLIALFALHFLLSLVGFTLHLPQLPTPASAHALAAPAGSEPLAKAATDADGLGSSVEHGLTDDLPDMPDGTLRASKALKTSFAPLLRTPYIPVALANPTPSDRDRPPRLSAHA